MVALTQLHGDHALPYQLNFRRLVVHPHLPVAVLRDGGIQQPVPVAGDKSLHKGVLKGGQLQGGGGEDLIALPE